MLLLHFNNSYNTVKHYVMLFIVLCSIELADNIIICLQLHIYGFKLFPSVKCFHVVDLIYEPEVLKYL